MTDIDRARLARILGMLGSEYAGERDSAAIQAEAFRKRHGLKWEDLLALPPAKGAPEPMPQPDPWQPEPPQWSPSTPIPPEWLSPRPGPWKRRWYKSVKVFHVTCEVIVICIFLGGCVGNVYEGVRRVVNLYR